MENCTEKSEKPLYNWTDVTKEFIDASSQLGLGILLHDSSFGLFEAMSAIEMMDPKMDAGMVCNQIKRKVLTMEQGIEAGTIKIKDLAVPELIGITDATLCCLVTWLEGHSLAQTVFTNLYLHNPHLIEDRYLKAFSICSLRIVDLIRDKINRAGVFEEEDFQPLSYGFKMAPDMSDARCCGMMKEIEDDLNRLIKTTRSKPGENRNDSTEHEHEVALALHSRIRFYRLFHSMLLAFNKEKCEGISQAQKLLSQLSELLPQLVSSSHLGIKPAVREATKNDYPTIMGFEPLINQRLLPPTFPRYTMIKTSSEAFEYFDNLFNKLQVVTGVPSLTTLHNILEVFTEFSKCSPCVLARSILQQTFLPPNHRVFGSHTVVDFMKDTIRNFMAPPALAQKCSLYNNPQAKEYVDALLTHAVNPICMLFQITGHNRARQRDKWAHVLEDFASLQEEADKVDSYLHSLLIKVEPNRSHLACFGTWVLYHSLQVMINYVLSGFELELYALYEYHYVYWYLYELLYAWLVSTLHRAENFLLEHETMLDQQMKSRNNKKNHRRKKRSKIVSKEIVIAQTQQQMFGGYYKAVLGFQLDGKIKQTDFEFDSEEVRYCHRFAPFTNVVTPPMVHYSQYKRYECEPTAKDMYSAACKCFYQAKQLYESLPYPDEEIQSLIKISKTNFVVMKLLVGGHKKDSTDPPEFDFSQHKVYPIIKLV
ncbi:N-alpha-acetyltransferase 35, NatC auxiliary subunit-like isoform X2 [Gigantopelta aegis]|uniref:N-alpha-acetyltransferase 35, NatC auxiliary subunit-like isoform X2 n=1 Tax=Gigantopelta aegis TaxID=1735272 RepID=UPI001B88CCBE|nr:N-alpha-acetyltransferase 35, NatC auxiliary subunit-like isoform X2 [Gigantopelta aegis]